MLICPVPLKPKLMSQQILSSHWWEGYSASVPSSKGSRQPPPPAISGHTGPQDSRLEVHLGNLGTVWRTTSVEVASSLLPQHTKQGSGSCTRTPGKSSPLPPQESLRFLPWLSWFLRTTEATSTSRYLAGWLDGGRRDYSRCFLITGWGTQAPM